MNNEFILNPTNDLSGDASKLNNKALAKHYDDLWQKSKANFEQGLFQYDPLIDAAEDTRLGITLLARPSAATRRKIVDMLTELHLLEPNQHYYPESDLHITILSLVTCENDFTLAKINAKDYIDLIKQVTAQISPFHLRFSGITASNNCILIQGFPLSEQLNLLRYSLRQQFSLSSLYHTIDKRYAIQTAHSTVVRFKQTLNQPSFFVERLSQLRTHLFGEDYITEVELVLNNWYQQKAKTISLAKFTLG